jgi:hypothetical protein
MTTVRKFRPLTLGLAAVVGVTVVLLFHHVALGSQTAALLATVARELPPAGEQLDPHLHALDVARLQESPLFYETRRLYVPPAPTALATPPRPDFKFAGVFIVPGKPPIALLIDNASGVSRKVKPGDNVNGWTVQAVENKRVLLAYASENMELAGPIHAGGSGMQSAPLTRSAPPRLPVPARPAMSSSPPPAARLDGPPQL